MPSGHAKVRVRIADQPFGVLSLMKATGALEEALASHSASVEWVNCAAGMQVMDALAVGALDLGVVGEAPPIFAQAARAPVVYLAAEPPSPEGEAIVVREKSPIVDVTDLRGKTIAVTRGSNVVYFVVRALEERGLSLADVDLRLLPPADARVAFLRGDVDAWAIWNPLLASIRNASPVRVLRDARGLASNRAFYVGRRASPTRTPMWSTRSWARWGDRPLGQREPRRRRPRARASRRRPGRGPRRRLRPYPLRSSTARRRSGRLAAVHRRYVPSPEPHHASGARGRGRVDASGSCVPFGVTPPARAAAGV